MLWKRKPRVIVENLGPDPARISIRMEVQTHTGIPGSPVLVEVHLALPGSKGPTMITVHVPRNEVQRFPVGGWVSFVMES